MPVITDDNTVETVANEYCINGGDKGAALRKAGYSESYSKSGEGLQIYDNLRLITAIKRIKAETEYTLSDYQQDLRDDRKLARDLKLPSAAISGSIALGRSMGYDKDNDAGKDKSNNQPKSEQELAALKASAFVYKRMMAMSAKAERTA